MQLSSQDPSDILQIIERAIEQNPHSENLLNAFKPILVKQRQLAAQSDVAFADLCALDKEKMKTGVALIRQIELSGQPAALKKIALDLINAVKEGIPNLKDSLDRLADHIEKDQILPADYLKPSEQSANRLKDERKPDLKDSPSNATFLITLVSRVALEQAARQAAPALDTVQWEKGYCPVCGDFPSIALIEEKEGRRFLHCSSCGHDWRYTRVVCPYCENEAPEGMDYFYVENKSQEAAFVCDKCKRYLVTLYRVGHLLARDMDVSAMALVHLDMIMQDKGYTPMATCPWNVLK